LGILFAILAAAGFGGTVNLMQLGLRSGKVRADDGMLVNLVAASVALVLASLLWGLLQPVIFEARGLLFFVAAGLMAPLFGRGSTFLAVARIGSTRTSSLGVSESLFAAPLAYLFLGQHITPLSAAGIVVVALGTVLFINESRRYVPCGEVDHDAVVVTVPVEPGEDACTPAVAARTAAIGVAFGLAAGFFFSMAGIFRQVGVDAIPSALLGATVGTLVALVVMTLNAVRRRRVHLFYRMPRRERAAFALSGIVASMGQVFFFAALDSQASVAVSTALKNTAPLFTFAFATAFMARGERLSLRLGLLVLIVAAGAALAAVGRL